jgi:hypothetical protein
MLLDPQAHQIFVIGGSCSAVWVREELGDTWRAANGEARSAYEQWRRTRSREDFVAYRAAQDRADAAQDALATYAELVYAGAGS